MNRFVRFGLAFLSTVTLTAGLVLTAGTTNAFGYGAADQPLAQITYSGNCDNPGFYACQPNFFGTGGFWSWVEIDTGSSPSTGPADFTAAGCGHTVGGIGGPGGAGGGGFHGTTTWDKFYGTASDVFNTFGAFAPQGQGSTFPSGATWWYVLPELGIAVPVATGHYSWHPTNGVSLNSQVAP